jgi:hypothetical protein
MRYMLLLANAPDAWEPPPVTPGSADEMVITDWATYTKALAAAGVLVDGAALHSPDAATSVRIRGGRRLVTDGPFADTEEHLIGYYVIDVPDLDTALRWAARIPNVRTGTIEIRPIQPGSEAHQMLLDNPDAAASTRE